MIQEPSLNKKVKRLIRKYASAYRDLCQARDSQEEEDADLVFQFVRESLWKEIDELTKIYGAEKRIPDGNF